MVSVVAFMEWMKAQLRGNSLKYADEDVAKAHSKLATLMFKVVQGLDRRIKLEFGLDIAAPEEPVSELAPSGPAPPGLEGPFPVCTGGTDAVDANAMSKSKESNVGPVLEQSFESNVVQQRYQQYHQVGEVGWDLIPDKVSRKSEVPLPPQPQPHSAGTRGHASGVEEMGMWGERYIQHARGPFDEEMEMWGERALLNLGGERRLGPRGPPPHLEAIANHAGQMQNFN